MGILTLVAGETTTVQTVTASAAAIVPGDQSGVPYQGYWTGFEGWRVEQRTNTPGWNYSNNCLGGNGAAPNAPPVIPWLVSYANGAATITSDPAGPFSTPSSGRMQLVSFLGSLSGAARWQGIVFDLVHACAPVINLIGRIIGSQVVIAWDNPNGTSTLYRVYYDANGQVETHRTAVITNSSSTGFVDTLDAVRFDGAGLTPVINYLVVSNCAAGGTSRETPVFTSGGNAAPFNYEQALKSLTPITALRHERLRR